MTEEERNLARKFLQELELEGYRWTADGREKYIVDNVFHKMLDLEQKINKLNNVIDRMAEVLEECRQNDCIETTDDLDMSEIAGVEKIKEYFMKEQK